MVMKTVFLHIGFYKTGSTSLQHNLAMNKTALAQQGIFYPYNPRAPYTQRWQHAPLAAALPGRTLSWLLPDKAKTLDRAYDRLFADFANSGCNTLVLSSEAFCDATVKHDQVAWLQQQLADFNVIPIAYIRRQDSYILSTYQEMLKSGRAAPLDFKAFPNASRLHFAHRLAPWREVFGKDNVIVRPFLPALWHKGEPLYDFLPLIGASAEGMELMPPQNEGLDYRSVELLRRLNKNSKIKRQQQSGLVRLANQADAYFKDHGGKLKMQLSTVQAEELRLYFREENAKALTGTDCSVDLFFPPVPEGQTERIRPRDLPEELLLELLWHQAPEALLGRKPQATKPAGKTSS